MKAPAFWQSRSALTGLLYPFSKAYAAIVQSRIKKSPRYESPLPILCVGNAVMGGSGKTPVVHALIDILSEMGHVPATLLRGYGASVKAPLWVEKTHTVKQVGDEALLHRHYALTCVSPDRVAGAKQIEQNKAVTCIVMDDGLQNPSLKKTASLLVVDGSNSVGNGLVFPAGPLRETIEDAVKRVQAIVILGDDTTHLATRYGFACPVFQARLQPALTQNFAGKPVIAFAGIGRPDKFFQSLEQADAIIAEKHGFADHHPYSHRELHALIDKANTIGGLLVTTRKDWVRLPNEIKPFVQVLDVVLEWQDRNAVKNWLECVV